LKMICQYCGALLARAGDTKYGPLFTSSWPSETELGISVTVNGRKLSRSEAIRHQQQQNELLERRGKPLHEPLLHGMTALLMLPAGLQQDYPDLLVRCDQRGDRRGHGDLVLDRMDVLGRLRDAVMKPQKRKVKVTRPFSEYLPLRSGPGPSEKAQQREVWRWKVDAMPIGEFERRMRERYSAP
jgi:hypothetical protein